MGNCLGSSAQVDLFNSHPTCVTSGSSRTSQSSLSTTTSFTVSGPSVGSSSQGVSTPRSEKEILSSSSLKAFSFSDLKTATKKFRRDSVIGGGGFGCVFKGWINEQTLLPAKAGTGMMVAVKKLKPEDCQGHREWVTEVNYLGQIHHPNLVKLIGYCAEGENRLLVYEYMSNGSLENHLFRREPQPFSWETRFKVAIGAAKGLSFLHDAESQVTYRNIKASNILVDVEFHAKLSDFGLAKAERTGGDQSCVSTQPMATYGYAAPELATGHLSAKSDVYSYGVVLLQLLTGRYAFDTSKGSEGQYLMVDWVKPYIGDQGNLSQIMDTKLEGEYPQKAAFKVASLAVQCINPEPRLRPKMSEVLEELEKL